LTVKQVEEIELIGYPDLLQIAIAKNGHGINQPALQVYQAVTSITGQKKTLSANHGTKSQTQKFGTGELDSK